MLAFSISLRMSASFLLACESSDSVRSSWWDLGETIRKKQSMPQTRIAASVAICA